MIARLLYSCLREPQYSGISVRQTPHKELLGRIWTGAAGERPIKFQVLAIYELGQLTEKYGKSKVPDTVDTKQTVLLIRSNLNLPGINTTELILPTALEARIAKDSNILESLVDKVETELIEAELIKVAKESKHTRAREKQIEELLKKDVRIVPGPYNGDHSEAAMIRLIEKAQWTRILTSGEAKALKSWAETQTKPETAGPRLESVKEVEVEDSEPFTTDIEQYENLEWLQAFDPYENRTYEEHDSTLEGQRAEWIEKYNLIIRRANNIGKLYESEARAIEDIADKIRDIDIKIKRKSLSTKDKAKLAEEYKTLYIKIRERGHATEEEMHRLRELKLLADTENSRKAPPSAEREALIEELEEIRRRSTSRGYVNPIDAKRIQEIIEILDPPSKRY